MSECLPTLGQRKGIKARRNELTGNVTVTLRLSCGERDPRLEHPNGLTFQDPRELYLFPFPRNSVATAQVPSLDSYGNYTGNAPPVEQMTQGDRAGRVPTRLWRRFSLRRTLYMRCVLWMVMDRASWPNYDIFQSAGAHGRGKDRHGWALVDVCSFVAHVCLHFGICYVSSPFWNLLSCWKMGIKHMQQACKA